jgi:hypothetical protein
MRKLLVVALVMAGGCDLLAFNAASVPRRPTPTPKPAPGAPPSPQPKPQPQPMTPPPPPSPPNPPYTLYIDEAQLAADQQGAPWCSDGSAPSVRVTASLAGTKSTTAPAPGLDATFGAAVLSAGELDFEKGFSITVEATCDGATFFTAGSAQLNPTGGDIQHGALELDHVGNVDKLLLHFSAVSYGSGGGDDGGTSSDSGSGGDSGNGGSWPPVGDTGGSWTGGGDTGPVDTGGTVASGGDTGSGDTGGTTAGDGSDGGGDSSGSSGGDGSDTGSWTDTSGDSSDGGADSGSTDSGSSDSGSTDSGSSDSGSTDTGSGDSGSTDSGSDDSGDWARRHPTLGQSHAFKRVSRHLTTR